MKKIISKYEKETIVKTLKNAAREAGSVDKEHMAQVGV